MEKQMWEDIKAKNWKVVENKIADEFQSVHSDGARDRAGEIALIKNLNVGKSFERFQIDRERRQHCGFLHDFGSGND